MNKNLLLVIGGLVVAGAVGAFFMLKKPAMPGPMMGGGGRETVSSSFAELMKLGKDYTCTFDETDDVGSATSGTVYVADQGNKLNGEFMQNTGGTTTQMNVIRDGEYTYFWSSADMKGYKMKIDPEQESLWGGTDSENKNFDENEPVDFDCAPWRPEASMFVPPSNIEFMDMSAQMEMMEAQMQQVQNSMPDQPAGANCSLCNQAPAGESRTQCLAAMGC